MRALRGDVHLVAPETLALFEELTGFSGDYFPGRGSARGRRAEESAFCVNPVHDQPVTDRICAKCDRAPRGQGECYASRACATWKVVRPAIITPCENESQQAVHL
jgi:hypothetical protein